MFFKRESGRRSPEKNLLYAYCRALCRIMWVPPLTLGRKATKSRLLRNSDHIVLHWSSVRISLWTPLCYE